MTTRRPDIVLLVLDTQRADRLSYNGYARETSPYIDRLAADSTIFRYAFSTAQWTIPSHASMFTGLYPSIHTTNQSRSVLPGNLPTLAERLRGSGYFTTAFCNNPLVGVVNNGLRRGFLSFLNYSGLLTSHPNQASVGAGWIDRYRQLFKRIVANLLNRIQDSFARSELMLAFSFTPFMVPLWQTALSFKGNTARSLNDAARMLTERQGVGRDQPIFAFINLMGTHAPYRPPHRFIERFAPHILRDKSARRYLNRFNSDIYGWLAPLSGPINSEHKQTLDTIYDAEVAHQDERVGAFLDALRHSGRLDRTMIITCADHGDHLGEKQLIGHSFAAYNEVVHVPLLIHDPSGDLPRGGVVDRFVSTRRIFNTVLTTAGVADDAERAYTLAQSESADPDGGTVFAEADPPQNVVNMMLRRQPELVRDYGYDQTRRAVLSGAHKLIQTGDADVELYDIREDPREMLNLRDILPERVEDLQEQLQNFVSHNGSLAASASEREREDDPQVRRRLHDLGYLE